jgi:hypothetical protein
MQRLWGVYRGYLESVIDRQLYPMASKSVRPGLIFFQRELAGLRSGRNGGRRQYPSIIGAQLLYATIVLVIAIYGGFVAYDVRFSFLENWPIPLILYVIIFAVAFAILVSAFIEVKRAEEKSRNVVALMTAESRDGSADGSQTIDPLLAKPDRAGTLPATAGNGAGRARRGVVRDCPPGTSQDRREWHARGTTSGDRWHGWRHSLLP